jgi:hypothetical protein
MNTNAASLAHLHDIIVPDPVPWWPPAPGWYWVLGFVLVLLLFVAFRVFVRWQHNRYRREALAELARAEAALQTPERRASILLALAELLKRTALTAFPREQVATLTGPEWFAFLDGTARGSSFSEALGPTLENAIYDPRNAVALDEPKLQALLSAIRHWIKHHQAGVVPKKVGATKDLPSDKPSLPSFPSVKNPSVQKPC